MVKCKSMHELIYCSMATGEMLETYIMDLLKVPCDKNALLEVPVCWFIKNGRIIFFRF